jgi:hypothetical protein
MPFAPSWKRGRLWATHHTHDQVWRGPAIGVMTLLREVCISAIFSGWPGCSSLPAQPRPDARTLETGARSRSALCKNLT